MKRKPVKSSNIVSVGHDPDSKVLEVEFNSGGIYRYADVPCVVHAALMDAPSLGSFFHRSIKGGYTCEKVEKE